MTTFMYVQFTFGNGLYFVLSLYHMPMYENNNQNQTVLCAAAHPFGLVYLHDLHVAVTFLYCYNTIIAIFTRKRCVIEVIYAVGMLYSMTTARNNTDVSGNNLVEKTDNARKGSSKPANAVYIYGEFIYLA